MVARPAVTGAAASGKFSAELDKLGWRRGGGAGATPVEGGRRGGGHRRYPGRSVPSRDEGQSPRRAPPARATGVRPARERLEELRRGLLPWGRFPRIVWRIWPAWSAKSASAGPTLVIARLLDEIELRASVELAKLGLPSAYLTGGSGHPRLPTSGCRPAQYYRFKTISLELF